MTTFWPEGAAGAAAAGLAAGLAAGAAGAGAAGAAGAGAGAALAASVGLAAGAAGAQAARSPGAAATTPATSVCRRKSRRLKGDRSIDTAGSLSSRRMVYLPGELQTVGLAHESPLAN